MDPVADIDAALGRAAALEARAGALVRHLVARRRGSASPLAELRVLSVLDEMSRASFGPDCRLTCPAPGEWRELVEPGAFDLLLVESAWEGNAGTWRYQVGTYAYERSRGLPELTALVERCRAVGIPSVFWNKEDPVHFERFAEAASLFDHVLTSDANRIPAYRALDAPHQRSVGALTFGAQPLLHNPLPVVEERDPRPCFAGTYYRTRHEERQAGLDMLLDAARPFGLEVFDRMHGSGNDDFGFPERFESHVRGRLPYAAVIGEYKRRRVFLNVNSVLGSPTMLSRRVFELLACDTSVISTPSVGVDAMLPGHVTVVRTGEEATDALVGLLADEPSRRRHARAARRFVFSHHTYAVRLAAIAAAAEIEVSVDADREVAALVLLDGDEPPEAVERLAAALTAQTARPRRVLLGCPESSERLAEPLRRIGGEVHLQAAGNRSDRARELAARARTPWVAPMPAGALPAATTLEDLVNCTRFAGADVVGAPLPGGPELRRADGVRPEVALARAGVVEDRGWPDDPAAFREWVAGGVRVHAAEQD